MLDAGRHEVHDFSFLSQMKIDWQVSDTYTYARHLYRGTLDITVSINTGKNKILNGEK